MSGDRIRVFTASLDTETNTFSPVPTGWGAFERYGIGWGAERDMTSNEARTGVMKAWREAALRDGYALTESIAAAAEPGGRVLQAVYERLRDELLTDLQAALPVDVVLLNLHGAMAATSTDDCEGDILGRVRAIVGPHVVVGVELDLHAHITAAMLEHATAILTYKEYPHDDIVETANALYRLCTAAARGETTPVMRAHDCRIIGTWPTTREPMRSFVDHLRSLERDGILGVSLAHGFPWADVADVGAKVVVVADGDDHRAAACAEDVGRAFWDMREAARHIALPIDAALDAALAAPSAPVVLADGADNPGGGAAGDSTFIIRRIIERGIRNVVSGAYYDPGAVELCFEAGIGATIGLRIGGKLGPASGDPLDVRATIRNLRDRHEQTALIGTMSLGRAAWLSVDGVDLVLVSVRSQTFAPDAFTGLGLRLTDKRIIVVKSAQHFYRNFAAIASHIVYVAAPGALRYDVEAIAYSKRDTRYWPRVADPFAVQLT